MTKFENFESAFSLHSGGCRNTCSCGKEFYNSSGDWSWEDGELEKLESNKEAIDLNWSVSLIDIQGEIFVLDCNCWHEKAHKIINFIDRNAYQIVEYLKLEKKRKTKEAENSPVLE